MDPGPGGVKHYINHIYRPPPHTHIYRPRFIGYIKKFSILSSELPLKYYAVQRVCYMDMP